MQFGRAIRSYLVWSTLLTYLLVSFGSAFGAVWCPAEGEDCGPQSASSDCCQGDSQGSCLLADRSLEEDSCTSCTDITLSQTVIKARVRPLRGPLAQDAQLGLAALPSPYSSGDFKKPIFSRLTAMPSPLVLAQLRTVVLLH